MQSGTPERDREIELANAEGLELREVKQVEAMGRAFVAAPPVSPSPKALVLAKLEEFRAALLECRTVCNRVANGKGSPFDAEQVELCLTLMSGGVGELLQTVQNKL